MKRVRLILIITLFLSTGISGSGQHTKQKELPEKLTGTIVAYDHFMTHLPCYHMCGASLIVRLKTKSEKQIRYVIINFRYPDRNFPEKLVAVNRTLTFRVEKTPKDDEILKEFVPGKEAKTGKEIELQLPFWRKVPGAEKEKLPFGKKIWAYSLVQEITSLLGSDSTPK